MSQILQKVRDVDPNNSDAIKDTLSTFFQNLSKHTDIDCFRWLRALESVIIRFPKFCMPHRNNIETYLAHFLDSTDYYNVIEAAKCAHAVQQVRPTQQKTATPKSCWRDQMDLLCHAAHALIGAIFPNAVDIFKNNTQNQKEQLEATSPLSSALTHLTTLPATRQNNNVIDKQALFCTRLRNVFVFLQAMLVEVYPVGKPIRPQSVLDVIVRALSVSSSNAVVAEQDPSDVATVKTQALRSLDALVACLGPNLIPFSPLVFRFVMQTLKWSSDHPSEESRKVRVAAYNSLGLWLNTLHSHRTAADGRGRCWEDELTGHIIDDITPARHIVQLTMSSQPTKHLSKKAKRKLANSMLQESSMASYMPGEKNKVDITKQISDDVAIAALECAETFFTVCGVFLKPNTHKRFQERLVRECYNLSTFSSERSLCLLRSLDACRKAAAPGVPPPTQYCLHLYSTMVNSQNREIAKFCSQALLDIRLHLHCSPPSLNFALEAQPENQKKIQDEKKKISEKNRAALEALLGPDKMPTLVEDVITIADEPSNKKPRLELDISDKISVSSDSGKSIEISDDSEEEDSMVQEVEVVIENVRESEETSEGNLTTLVVNQSKEIQVEEGVESNDEISNKDAIENMVTQYEGKGNEEVVENETDSTPLQETVTIHEAPTQMPLNTSNDTIDEEDRPLSMEVAYDYPSTGKEKVTVLEKLEDENLPSTNDTDDIQITCGQVVKSSQDVESEKKSEDTTVKAFEEVPKENGVDKSPVKLVENGVSEGVVDNETVIPKIVVSDAAVTVEDMLADFVDEVNEDTQT